MNLCRLHKIQIVGRLVGSSFIGTNFENVIINEKDKHKQPLSLEERIKTIGAWRMHIVKTFAVVLQLSAALVLLVPLILVLLSILAWSNQKLRILMTGNKSELNTALYCGRVSHTRFHPILHTFSYPLFFCLLDLSEIPRIFRGTIPFMWPLTYIISFREKDHLKNGEGRERKSVKNLEEPLEVRIRRLVQEKTNGRFRPTAQNPILLLTHLSYFGYCFNPVSFYFIMKDINMPSADPIKDKGKIEAIVAEVSNTPWNEMQCYVLHPDSKDMIEVKDGAVRKNKSQQELQEDCKSINYIFQKAFHVSPFMEMDHIYDWTFWNIEQNRIVVSTSMLKEEPEMDPQRNESSSSPLVRVKYFNAYFDIHKTSFTPFRLCYQMIRFPMYCMIIQIWIHIQAFKLFIKGVEFIPHPKGSETIVSSVIAFLMAPFFAMKDWIRHGKSCKSE